MVKLKLQKLIKEFTRFVIKNKNKLHIFYVDVFNDGYTNSVEIDGADLKWTDTKISDNTFKRILGKNTLYIRDGVAIVKQKELPARPFKK